MIDSAGFRANVGVIVVNNANQLFWAKRIGFDSWQFPQGGVDEGEEVEQAMWRELYEEIGLQPQDVKLIASTKHWLRYYLPKSLIRDSIPRCIGQKQKWFLVRLLANEKKINLKVTDNPEFDGFQWVNYWYPLSQIVSFKREVYRRALKELAPHLFGLSSGGRKIKMLSSILEHASTPRN